MKITVSPFSRREGEAFFYRPCLKLDASLQRKDALACCVVGIHEMATREELEEIRDLLWDAQTLLPETLKPQSESQPKESK